MLRYKIHQCGGAQTRARPSSLGRRKRRQRGESGAQTSRKRKAGSRVTAKDAFKGEGSALNTDEPSVVGTGFRKQAGRRDFEFDNTRSLS